jgi:hypothetical protein
MKIRNGLLALLLFVLGAAGAASGQTRTLSLSNGDSLTPASPFVDASGGTTYFGGFINGQVASSSPATFTFSITFTATGVIDEAAGIYGGTIVAPNSSFAVTESSSRKSITTSGSIDAGTVTYRLIDGRAEIISVVSSNLTISEGKNRRRTTVGSGTLEYGTVEEGSGTMTLNFF